MANTQNHLHGGAARGLSGGGLEADWEGSMAEADALEAQDQQAGAVATATLAQSYESGLAMAVQAKYEQVGHIEDRLEGQIEAQEAKVQKLTSNRPGLLSRPGARRAWASQQMLQQRVLHKLNERLEAVREIRDTMGAHGPKLEELAERRFRRREPELAMGWEDMRAAERGHDAIMRRKEQERRRVQERGRGHGLSLTWSLGDD